jgi:outer membrane receptor protein involved in Fe transport
VTRHALRSAALVLCTTVLCTAAASPAARASSGEVEARAAQGLPETAAAPSSTSTEALPAEDITLGDVLNFIDTESVVQAQGFFHLTRSELPSTSYHLSERQLIDTDARSVAQLLDNFVPGVQIANHPWTGKLIGSRGIQIDNNAKTSVMVDELRLNQRQHFGTHGYLDLPLLGDIREGEYIMGPGAIVHGSGAINGVANMLLRTGIDTPGLRARAGYAATQRGGLGEVSYGLPYGEKESLFLYAGYVQSAGFAPARLSHFLPQDVPTYMRAYRRSPSFKATVNWIHDTYEVLLLHAESVASVPYGASEQVYSLRTPDWLSRISAGRARVTFGLAEGHALTLSVSGMLQQFGLYPQDTLPGAHEVAFAGREGALSGTLVYRVTAVPEHRLAMGAEAGVRQFGDDFDDFERSPFPYWGEVAAFAEDIYKPVPELTLAAGARYDVNLLPERIESQVRTLSLPTPRRLSYRASAVYNVSDDITARLAYNNGFRTPDASYYGHWFKTAATGPTSPFQATKGSTASRSATDSAFAPTCPSTRASMATATTRSWPSRITCRPSPTRARSTPWAPRSRAPTT